MFPIQNDSIWAMYKKSVASFWTVEEVDLSKDKAHWESLTDAERLFLSNVLAFFAASDGIVLENLAQRFLLDTSLPEARAFYGFQIAMENVHSEMYSILIDTYVTDEDMKLQMFDAVEQYPSIKKKAEWAIRWISDDSSYATRLAAFACVEGIFFSASFCSIYWMKKRGLMPGLTFSNELISRDEAMHTDFAVLLYKTMTPISSDAFSAMIKEAVDIELQFISDALPINLLGMNAAAMGDYVMFVADRLCVQLGHSKLFQKANPFSWMELISLEGKTNFFEKRVGEYSRAASAKKSSEDSFACEEGFF